MTTQNINPTQYPKKRKDNAYWDALMSQEEYITPLEPTEKWEEPRRNAAPPPTKSANGSAPVSAQKRVWDAVTRMRDTEVVLELKVTGFNKGGLIVDVHGLQGFVPASQLNHMPHFHIESERIRELKRRQNQCMNLRIIEIDAHQNRLILSERAANIEADERDDLLSTLKPGAITKGHITNVTSFGAFVDLGGVEGLIHISELSWSRVEHPSHIVRANEQVTVKVLEVDPYKERIALSLKRLNNNPWDNIEARYEVGQIVEGEISNIVHFGAFVQVEDGLEGLIHISELAEGTFLHPRSVVSLGQPTQAIVIEVDGSKRRLALSLRRLAQSTNTADQVQADAAPSEPTEDASE